MENFSKEEDIFGYELSNFLVPNKNVGVVATSVDVIDSGVSGSSTLTGVKQRKRRFPTVQEFAAAGEDRIKRKIAPVANWDTLKVRELYLVKRVINMDVVIEGSKQTGTYAELEDKKQQMINVWLTDIIREELEKYSLYLDNVYIMPLGETKSKETGYSYHDFVIQKYDDKQ